MKNKKCLICSWPNPNSMLKTCNPLCQRKHERNLKRIKEEKDKERKVKVKTKKHNSISYLFKKADDLWAIAVKVNYGYRCAKCNKGNDEVQLHSHHLFTRSRKSTRLDIDNWICLCASHHTLSSEFSAHKTGNEFFLWLEEIKWREWINERMKNSLKVLHVSPDWIKEQIQILEEFISNNK